MKGKGRTILTPSGRLMNVFSRQQLGLVQEETLVVFYTRMPRETVRITWNEVEIRKKFSPRSKHTLLYRKWNTQTDGKSLNSLKASPGYKSGNRRIHGYRCLYRRADGKSNLSARSKIRYSRSSCFSEMKKNVQVCVSQNSAPMSWRIGIERFGGTHLKFLGCIWNKIEFGKERGNLEQFSQKVNFISEILARPVRRNNHLRKPHDKQIVPAK